MLHFPESSRRGGDGGFFNSLREEWLLLHPGFIELFHSLFATHPSSLDAYLKKKLRT